MSGSGGVDARTASAPSLLELGCIVTAVSLLDFGGPGEVFAATDGFNVYTVAATAEPLVSQGFVTITPEYTIENSPKPDILVLPGGGTGSALRSQTWV